MGGAGCALRVGRLTAHMCGWWSKRAACRQIDSTHCLGQRPAVNSSTSRLSAVLPSTARPSGVTCLHTQDGLCCGVLWFAEPQVANIPAKASRITLNLKTASSVLSLLTAFVLQQQRHQHTHINVTTSDRLACAGRGRCDACWAAGLPVFGTWFRKISRATLQVPASRSCQAKVRTTSHQTAAPDLIHNC